MWAEAIQAIRTQRDKSIKIFANRKRIDDTETVKSTYEYFASSISFPPRVSLTGVRDMLRSYAEQNAHFKNRKAEEFVDHSLTDELEKEGFFEKRGA